MIDDPKKNPNEKSDPAEKQHGQDWEQRQRQQPDPSKKNPAHDPANEDDELQEKSDQRRAS